MIILYNVFQSVTFTLTVAYELNHRIESQDLPQNHVQQ